MARKADYSYDNLIGEYPLLSDGQKEYIRIRTDPRSKIDGLSDKDIADAIGVGHRTIGLWKTKKEVKDALVSETNRKKADKYPDIVSVIENIIFDRNAENRDKLKAVELWGKFHGVTEEAKQKVVEKKSSDNKRFEDFLKDREEELGDDVENVFDNGTPDDESEELYSDTSMD